MAVFVLFSCYRIYLYHPYQSFYFNILAKKNIKDTLDVDYTGAFWIALFERNYLFRKR